MLFKRQVTNFINDDESVSVKPGELFIEGSRLGSVLEAADPPGGRGKEQTVAPMAGENTQRDREVCFPSSWRPKKNEIVVAAQIPPIGQFGELVYAIPWPVPQCELVECFDRRETDCFCSKYFPGVVSGVDFCF